MRVSDLRPGWRTDFILHEAARGTEIIEHDDCIVVRTLPNPRWYWGNCLLLRDDPRDEDRDRWVERFAREVAHGRPDVGHVAIGINTAFRDQVLPSWSNDGFERHVNAVMRLVPGAERAPARPARGVVEVRPIDWAQEVEAIVALQCADVHGFEPKGYAAYRRAQFEQMRHLHAAGRLEWFGLWCDGVLAADCGVMRTVAAPGATVRFQRVSTHPEWRRRGLCRALVSAVTAFALEQWQAREIIMVADPDDVAIGIYRSLGYEAFEREWLYQLKAPCDRTTQET